MFPVDNKKKLILALIKDDLINSKLIIGLRDMGIDAGHYNLHLCEIVFGLMEFEDTVENDRIYDRYFELSNSVKYIDISESAEYLSILSIDIYNYLNEQKDSLIANKKMRQQK